MNDTTASDFKIEIGSLARRNKPGSKEDIAKVDKVAEPRGYVSRETGKKRGRPASPRTGQVHAKVFPDVSEQISAEATRRGVTQGVLIEEAWELYKEKFQVA